MSQNIKKSKQAYPALLTNVAAGRCSFLLSLFVLPFWLC